VTAVEAAAAVVAALAAVPAALRAAVPVAAALLAAAVAVAELAAGLPAAGVGRAPGARRTRDLPGPAAGTAVARSRAAAASWADPSPAGTSERGQATGTAGVRRARAPCYFRILRILAMYAFAAALPFFSLLLPFDLRRRFLAPLALAAFFFPRFRFAEPIMRV
jgi:hypothetical protein